MAFCVSFLVHFSFLAVGNCYHCLNQLSSFEIAAMEKALKNVALQLTVSVMLVAWIVENSAVLISDKRSFYSLFSLKSVPTLVATSKTGTLGCSKEISILWLWTLSSDSGSFIRKNNMIVSISLGH